MRHDHDAVMTAVTPTEQGHETPTRERILDAALDLMAEQGTAATSMRQLAKSLGLNVAAIYHYFESKEALLRAVIEERQYPAQLGELPSIDQELIPHLRLEAFLIEVWRGSQVEAPIWRLLIAEALRHDQVAIDVGAELLATIEPAVQSWLERLFPECLLPYDVAARVVVGRLYGLFVETLFMSEADRLERVRVTSSDIALILFGER